MFAATYFSDPEHARLIYLAAAGLVVFGLVVAATTVWWWKASKVDHPVLGPLEVMSTRTWEDSDRLARRQALEAVRLSSNDYSPSPAGGVAYVPLPIEVPEVTDAVLDQFAANDVFDEYTRLTSASPSEPIRRPVVPAAVEAAVPVSEMAELPYDVEDYHGYDERPPVRQALYDHEQDDDHAGEPHVEAPVAAAHDEYDDEYDDVWDVSDDEEGLDAGYSIDPLLRRRDNY